MFRRVSLPKSRRPLASKVSTPRYLHVYGAPIDIHPEVQEALAAKQPVVALETTLITSGLPWPTNLNVGKELEGVVRQTGSVPATIGIIGGRVKVGLEPHEIERLANYPEHGRSAKISRRDIAPVIASKGDGGTTCSATLIFAALAGIKVFATGGLGGVHRGGESTMDISADLLELTRCPVGLVSAGVKSILDIGRTLEYLETIGVPVLPYGTNEFPAFFTRHSGYKLPWRVDDPAMAAQILHTQKLLNMSMGALFAAPVPEDYEAAGAEIQKAVEQAVQESEANGMSKRGKEVTPWLLQRVSELTKGSSIENNIALLKNTALIGGKIAVEYSKIVTGSNLPHIHVLPIPAAKNAPIVENKLPTKPHKADIIIAGAAAVDITARVSSNEKGQHSTSPGTVSITLGGVGRNIAEAAHRASYSHRDSKMAEQSSPVLLVSAVGNDPFARLLGDEMTRMDMRTDGLVSVDGAKTAVCNMLLSAEGDLMNGVAAMEVVEQLPAEKILNYIDENAPSFVCLDGNLSAENIKNVVKYCYENTPSSILFEPTSVTKSARIIPAIRSNLHRIDSSRSCLSFTTPNLLELAHMYQCCSDNELTSTTEWWNVIDSFSLGGGIRNELDLLSRLPVSDDDPTKGTLSFLVTEGLAQMAINLLPFFQHILVKCGPAGVVLVIRIPSQDAEISTWSVESSNLRARRIVSKGPSGEMVIIQHLPSLSIREGHIVNVTGAGDSFVGSILANLSRLGPKAFQTPSLAIKLIEEAQQAAVLTLGSEASVSPLISTINQTRKLL